jgi:hypothetical protein
MGASVAQQQAAPRRPKLDPVTGIVDAILEQDKPRHRKRHHTVKRIYERLREEHGIKGGILVVTDYISARNTHNRRDMQSYIGVDTEFRNSTVSR